MEAKIRNELKREFEEAKRNLTELNEDLSGIVEKYPWPTLLAATVVGFAAAFIGLQRITALAAENKDVISDILSKEFGINLAKGFDLKSAAAEVVNSAIGA